MSFGFGFALPAYPLRGGTGNNPFNQLGPTLDLSFTGVVTDLTDPNGYTLNTDFIIPQYQIAAQYVVWETGVGLVDKTFSQIITFTRASTATYFDSTGTLQSAAIDVPRLDYDPSTLAAQGLLIEEQRTNSICNNTMQGAVAGTPGTLPTNWATVGVGLAFNVVGLGTEAGLPYIDIQVVGTTGGTSAGIRFDTNTGIAAVAGQTWTSSAYARMVAGSTTNISAVSINCSFLDAVAGVINSTSVSFTSTISQPSLPLARRTVENVVAGVGTLYARSQIIIAYASGVAIDITLRIGLPQLELGAFATSVIPTTTTALTRSADVASVNTLSPWYNATEGTVYAELQSLSPLTGAQSVALNKYPHVWQIEAGASDSTLWCYGLNSELYIATTYNNIGTVPSGINKIAAALAASGGQSLSSLNGAAAVNRNGTLTGTATGFFLGRDSTAGVNNFLNGYLRRITYYPRRLSNAELQAITA